MVNRSFNGRDVSLLGYGCMRLPCLVEGKQDIDVARASEMIDYAYAHGVNYFDTAYTYHDGMSELFIGEALKKYPRDSFFLADKLPTWLIKSPEDVDRIFNEQLEKCQVDYFDYYLVHTLNPATYKTCRDVPVFEMLEEKKAQGKIRALGFSFHSTPELLERILNEHRCDFVQIQLNYLDWELQQASRQYELIEKKGIPCIVMEPVRGGTLATLSSGAARIFKEADAEASTASWAIRYAASLPNVMTVLSGMSDMEQTRDNVRTMEGFAPLTSGERDVISRALTEFLSNATIPCTGCRYCMDCPAGVDIPAVFSLYNRHAIDKDSEEYLDGCRALGAAKQAGSCVACMACVERCPQGIKIPDRMKEIDTLTARLAR